MKNNMKWYRQLYMGELAEKKRQSVLQKLQDGNLHPRLYAVVLPSNEMNLLDILPQPVLCQEYYKKKELFVVGVAVGKKEAMELSGKIVMDAYRATGKTKVSVYLGDDFCSSSDEIGGDEKEPLYKEW